LLGGCLCGNRVDMEAAAVHPLTAFRKAKGLSQEQLAKRLKLSNSALGRVIRGKRKIGERKLPIIVKVTGISAAVLRPDLARLFLPVRQKRPSRRRAA
jgi:transcriptional regulator with XRE-family HTH domain